MYKQTFPAPRGHTEPAPSFVQGTTPVFSYTEGLTAPGIVRSSGGLSPVRLQINDGMLYFHSIKSTSGTVEGAIIDGHIVYPLSLGEKVNLA